MKFLLDHDVPAEIAHLLHYWGHEVTVLRSVLPTTASDEEVFGQACSRGLILISCNRDHFLTLARQTPDHPGLIILIRRRTRQAEGAHLAVLLQRAGEQGLRNNVNFAIHFGERMVLDSTADRAGGFYFRRSSATGLRT